MKKISFIIMITLLLNAVSFGQNPAKIIYAELGGPGIASINYDMRIMKKQDGLGFRVGVGGFSYSDNFSGDHISLLTVPVGLNYLLGKDGKNFFELGAGFTYLHTNDPTGSGNAFNGSFGILTLGYRLAPARGGFVFKAAITPIFGNGFFIPYYAGVGFGYKF